MTGDATTLLTSQLGGAALCAYVLNHLQKSEYAPWITAHTDAINRSVRAALAFVTTVGISYVWAPGTIAGTHVLTLTIPSWPDLGHGTWHWFVQYAMTHVVGNVLAAKQQPPATGK